MNRLLLLFITSMIFVSSVFAQDIIITKNAEKIDAKILEVSKSEIKYKESDNLDGPTFIITTDEIISIIYANGMVINYEHDINNIKGTNTTELLGRSGNTYFYDGKSMNEKSYSLFLHENCPDAYNLFRSGNNLAYTGWVLFSVGVGLDVGSFMGIFITGRRSNVTMITSIVGIGFEIACIPTLCIGYSKKHKSVDVFNRTCANQSEPRAYWSINATPNGIGLALNF